MTYICKVLLIKSVGELKNWTTLKNEVTKIEWNSIVQSTKFLPCARNSIVENKRGEKHGSINQSQDTNKSLKYHSYEKKANEILKYVSVSISSRPKSITPDKICMQHHWLYPL